MKLTQTPVITGVGTSILPLNNDNVAFNVGYYTKVTGTVTYSIEHTYDNVLDPAITPVWWPGAAGITAQTVAVEGNQTAAISAFRLNVTAGTGTAQLLALQQGII